MKVEDFMEEAKKKYQEQVDFEIEIIAKNLHATYERNQREKDCPHSNTSTYNHGYHEVCNDCGKEV